jgi:hypothetical protein
MSSSASMSISSMPEESTFVRLLSELHDSKQTLTSTADWMNTRAQYFQRMVHLWHIQFNTILETKQQQQQQQQQQSTNSSSISSETVSVRPSHSHHHRQRAVPAPSPGLGSQSICSSTSTSITDSLTTSVSDSASASTSTSTSPTASEPDPSPSISPSPTTTTTTTTVTAVATASQSITSTFRAKRAHCMSLLYLCDHLVRPMSVQTQSKTNQNWIRSFESVLPSALQMLHRRVLALPNESLRAAHQTDLTLLLGTWYARGPFVEHIVRDWAVDVGVQLDALVKV